MRRAEKAGFKAIALTVDTPRLGRREADIKNRSEIRNHIFSSKALLSLRVFCDVIVLCSFRFVLPPFLTLKNFEGLNLGKMDQVSVNITT